MIYFVQDELSGMVKIGHAADVWRRLAFLQTSAPGKLAMLAVEAGGVARERELHRLFAPLRARGEWFRLDPALRAYIAAQTPAVRPSARQHTRAFWNGMTAAEVSRATGLSKGFLSHLQSGERVCSPETALRLQSLTGVSAIRLVFGPAAADELAHHHLATIAEREAA